VLHSFWKCSCSFSCAILESCYLDIIVLEYELLWIVLNLSITCKGTHVVLFVYTTLTYKQGSRTAFKGGHSFSFTHVERSLTSLASIGVLLYLLMSHSNKHTLHMISSSHSSLWRRLYHSGSNNHSLYYINYSINSSKIQKIL